MAEKIKDAEDRMLESMFDGAAIADDGFSVLVVRKIRRRLWLRRLAVPLATIIGGAIAIKPLIGLAVAVSSLSSLIPQDFVNTVAALVPQAPTLVLGAMLLAACMLGLRTIED